MAESRLESVDLEAKAPDNKHYSTRSSWTVGNSNFDVESQKSKEDTIHEDPRPGTSTLAGAGEDGASDEKQEPGPPTSEPDTSSQVDWDGPDDPENPQNWPRSKKWLITMITACLNFVVSFGSSIFSTATEVTAEEFGVSQEVMILGVTLYVLGFACGPLVWGPLSELYGRRNPFMIGMIGFLIFQIPVGVATNLQTIFVCRFFAGAFGSAPLAITAGMYVDYWDAVMRGVATNAYAAAVFAGPVVGPIVGEFTVKNPNLGWRWTAWFTMIMAAFLLALGLFIVPESFPAILLQRKAARLRQETKNWALHSKLDEEPVHTSFLLRKYALKPIQMITQEPILIVMTLYISLVYGILYLIFFAYPISFEFDRGMLFGVSSLPFLAIFIGVLSACAYMTWETRTIFQPKLNKAKKLIPEERLPPMMVGSVVLVIGLFWFAWTSFPTISPWPQIISGVFIGAGVSQPCFTSFLWVHPLTRCSDHHGVHASGHLPRRRLPLRRQLRTGRQRVRPVLRRCCFPVVRHVHVRRTGHPMGNERSGLCLSCARACAVHLL